MPDQVFSIPSEGPPIVSSSLDGDKELQDSFATTWEAVDAAEAERAAQSPVPEAQEPPAAIETVEPIADAQPLEQPPKTVTTEYGSSKKKLSDLTKAPTEGEIRDVIDGPKEETPTEDEFESLQPHPASDEASRSHFGALKAKAREFRDELKTTKAKIAPLAAELGVPVDDVDSLVSAVRQMKTQFGLPSHDAQELEALRVLSNASHLQDSISYVRGFKEPVAQAKLQWIDRASRLGTGTTRRKLYKNGQMKLDKIMNESIQAGFSSRFKRYPNMAKSMR
jgi:hypothetical protein